MQFAQLFVVHVARPLGQPVISSRHDGENCTRHQYVVEVSHYKVGIVILEIHRRHGQHQSGKATDGEQEQEGQGEQHGCFKA